MYVDVHQHLWPAELIEALRRRAAPPYLRGWTLVSAGERPCAVDPVAHDVPSRSRLDAGAGRVLVSLSAPLGIEALGPDEAAPLLDAWHAGALGLPAPFRPWASVSLVEPDLDSLKGLLTGGFVGLQLPATALGHPTAVEDVAPLLSLCADLDRPVLVHPGVPTRAPGPAEGHPPWWAPVVDYATQLHAAWWAWHAVGRSLVPGLRLCFAAGAGLAPLHHERFTARGAGRFVVDPDVYVDTSSYRRQGVDALTRALGVDAVVLGSDRPYAVAPDLAGDLGDAAAHAITMTNPRRLLEGDPA